MPLALPQMTLAASTSQVPNPPGEGLVSIASVRAFTGVFHSGAQRARGALQTLAGEAQQRTGLLRGDHLSDTAVAVPCDGTRCEACGVIFGVLKRRNTCLSCDRFLCAGCLTGNPLAALAGAVCFCARTCPRCSAHGMDGNELAKCRADMEKGVNVILTLPSQKSRGVGFIFGGGAAKGGTLKTVPAWLSLGTDAAAAGNLCWATLEQRAGRPAEEGRIPFNAIVAVKPRDSVLELVMQNQTETTTLDFLEASERETWSGYIELGMRILTTEDDRAAIRAAQVRHRHDEVDERQARNEERKKLLQQGLGMRFTAEAMVARAGGQSGA
eukprot:TRINITY_DN76351_c0_g1_i1.p1 TRINITY_DN76351_c0_g1~~TRINITY_DN76351_c0_g1_i1.p1  ORF type:complete len:327 (-),score=50.31 TRINITY_DN76351_c0_g1_i1:81-1061(-)